MASLYRRPLGLHGRWLDVGIRLGVGLGALPLWALAAFPGVWLGLGARNCLGAGLGCVAPWFWLGGLGAAAACSGVGTRRALACYPRRETCPSLAVLFCARARYPGATRPPPYRAAY